jgi:RNA polymerase sigma-70 factor (ECF subfamily)
MGTNFATNQMLDSYRQTKNLLVQLYKQKKETVKQLEEKLKLDLSIDEQISIREQISFFEGEKRVVSEMISDCEWTIEWLETGRRPGNRRGIERRAAYQREKLMDPIRMQAFVYKSTAGSPANLSEWQRFQIEDAQSRLTPRERECYVLAHGECFSLSEIGRMLGISKSSVEEYVDRAQKKIL